ncbi:MAG: alpha/beta fold hydrolase [Hyphomicrobiales bacterium]
MSPLLLAPLRLFFAVTSRIVPPLAVRVAERLFTTPPHSRRRDIEHEMLADATRFAIPMDGGPELAGYSWGRPGDPIVLLVHGWTATATCFVNFINPLVDAGFRVVAYDVLAHGNSPGRTVSVTEWADTILAALATVGPVDCIIGHSMGAGGVVIDSWMSRFRLNDLKTGGFDTGSSCRDSGAANRDTCSCLRSAFRLRDKKRVAGRNSEASRRG